MSERNYLVVVGQSVDWAIEAEELSLVQSPAEWQGKPPVNVAEALGIEKDPDSEFSRILVAGVSQVIALLADGEVHLRTFPATAVLPLPTLVTKAVTRRVVDGVVLAEDQHPIIVIRLSGLAGEKPLSQQTHTGGTHVATV